MTAERARRWLAGFGGVGMIALASWELHDPLASMASTTAALMALNQVAPPLLLLALPRGVMAGRLLDPWTATAQFALFSVVVSLPGLFDRALVNALYTGPLGLLELLSGLMLWALLMPATRGAGPGWQVGLAAWLGSLPMMAVALVWMLSAEVLYTPYLDVICRWDVPPIVDQRWAGLVMLVAGLPLQAVGAWMVLGLGGSKKGLLF